MRPSFFSNLCNPKIFDLSEFDAQLSNEKGYTLSGLFPGMAGRDIEGRVNCKGEQSGRLCGAHGMSKFFDFRLSTHSAAPPATRQDKQHLGSVGERVGREGLRMRAGSKIAVGGGRTVSD